MNKIVSSMAIIILLLAGIFSLSLFGTIYAEFENIEIHEVDQSWFDETSESSWNLNHSVYLQFDLTFSVYNTGLAKFREISCQFKDVNVVEANSLFTDYNADKDVLAICTAGIKFIKNGKLSSHNLHMVFGFEPGEYTFKISGAYIEQTDYLYLNITNQTHYDISTLRNGI